MNNIFLSFLIDVLVDLSGQAIPIPQASDISAQLIYTQKEFAYVDATTINVSGIAK